MNVFIISLLPKLALGQQEQDKSLSFIKHLNSSSYTKIAEDERSVHKIAYSIREVGDAMMSNSSLCSVIEDIDRCDLIALSLLVILMTITLKIQSLKPKRLKIDLLTFSRILLLNPGMI